MKYKVTEFDHFVWLVVNDSDIAELLYKKGCPIYKLYDDDSEGYPGSVEDIRYHCANGGAMGIEMGFAKDIINELNK